MLKINPKQGTPVFLSDIGATTHQESVDLFIKRFNEIGAGDTTAELVYPVGIKLINRLNNIEVWYVKLERGENKKLFYQILATKIALKIFAAV